jgi:hypothetical protein
MKQELENYLYGEYYNIFYRKEGWRPISTNRNDLNDEDYNTRIVEIRMAKHIGLFHLLPQAQQEVLLRLYPENLQFPRRAEVARSLQVPVKTVSRREKSGLANIEKLFEKHMPRTP